VVSTALDRLVSGPARRGSVLTSSRFASYVVLDGVVDPQVVALVAPGAVRLPIAAQVAHLPALTAEAPAQVGGGTITADGHSWRPARWWDPRPRLHAPGLREHGWRLAVVVAAEPPSAYGIEADRATAAVTALAQDDPGPALALLGSGPGLTPAGDDVVAGALAALALLDRLPRRAARSLAVAARSRTTSLSAALLSAAARGQVVPEAARLLRALAGGDDGDAVGAAARDLFAVGSTSGHDLSLGLAAALTTPARVTARALV
jgi:uncharacterized protein DUF2877